MQKTDTKGIQQLVPQIRWGDRQGIVLELTMLTNDICTNKNVSEQIRCIHIFWILSYKHHPIEARSAVVSIIKKK